MGPKIPGGAPGCHKVHEVSPDVASSLKITTFVRKSGMLLWLLTLNTSLCDLYSWLSHTHKEEEEEEEDEVIVYRIWCVTVLMLFTVDSSCGLCCVEWCVFLLSPAEGSMSSISDPSDSECVDEQTHLSVEQSHDSQQWVTVQLLCCNMCYNMSAVVYL